MWSSSDFRFLISLSKLTSLLSATELSPRSPFWPLYPVGPGAPAIPGGPNFPGGPCKPLSPWPGSPFSPLGPSRPSLPGVPLVTGMPQATTEQAFWASSQAFVSEQDALTVHRRRTANNGNSSMILTQVSAEHRDGGRGDDPLAQASGSCFHGAGLNPPADQEQRCSGLQPRLMNNHLLDCHSWTGLQGCWWGLQHGAGRLSTLTFSLAPSDAVSHTSILAAWLA